jgi:hypothetical protein
MLISTTAAGLKAGFESRRFGRVDRRITNG